ncbi:MAG: hypothetical protein WCY11_09015 [Novosphingobium sp.]
MYSIISGIQRGHKPRLFLMLAGSALALSGCAAIPAPGIGAPPKAPAAFAAQASLTGTGAHWPGDGWWQG